ncbi:hypothetical protein R6Q59_011148 [Mikania micrantha]
MLAPPSTLHAIAMKSTIECLVVLQSLQNMHHVEQACQAGIKRFWVLNCTREKKKMGKTCLFRYYKRDEYVRPHKIMVTADRNKVCRFEHRSRDVCGLYHNATQGRPVKVSGPS